RLLNDRPDLATGHCRILVALVRQLQVLFRRVGGYRARRTRCATHRVGRAGRFLFQGRGRMRMGVGACGHGCDLLQVVWVGGGGGAGASTAAPGSSSPATEKVSAPASASLASNPCELGLPPALLRWGCIHLRAVRPARTSETS